MQEKFEYLNGALCFTHVKDEKSFDIGPKTIVLNNDANDLFVNGYCIRPNKSIILSNCTIEDAKNLILCTLPSDYTEGISYSHAKEIENTWIRAYPYDEDKPETKIDLFISDAFEIENVTIKAVFATAGTNCGLHKEHGYKEFHTQVFGIGIMQKFYENSFDSFNLEEYMPPGYTHEPFHYQDITYPWHQYYAVSDCVWFVAEIN